MQYRHTPDRNFEDFASGRVFYSQPGYPAFPVRLASEIYQRCQVHWRSASSLELCTLYDPTCGGGYWLGVLAYLHWDEISKIYASDIDPGAVELAERNLSLLTTPGLDHRMAEIEALLSTYGKGSHAGALESAKQFQRQLAIHLNKHAIFTHVFQADATIPGAVQRGISGLKIDILLADIPYGWHSEWQGTELKAEESPIWQMLEALLPVFSARSVIAIAANKSQKIEHAGYRRLERFQVGKRRIEILRMKSS
jgi:hypothetical protein